MSALSCACGWHGALPPNCTFCPYCGRDSATPPPVADAGAMAEALDALAGAAVRSQGRPVDGALSAAYHAAHAAALALHAAACDAARNDGWHAGLDEGRSQGLAQVDAACDVLSADGEEIAIVRMDDGAWGVATVYDLNVDALDIDADDVSPTAAILAAAAALTTPADDAGAGGAS